MNKHAVETIIGAIILIIAAGFFSYAFNTADVKTVEGYKIAASLDTLEGISVGSEITLNGIKIGSVIDTTLDQNPDTGLFTTNMIMSINDAYRLPIDSGAEIATSGLMGERFIRLLPGDSPEMLKDGDEMTHIPQRQTISDVLGPVMTGMLAPAESAIAAHEAYQITAKFDNANGISEGTDIRMNGIKIGMVSDVELQPQTWEGEVLEGVYDAVVTLRILNNIKLPTDSAAEIANEGLLGGHFIRIVAGADEYFLEGGDQIIYTSEAVNLEQLLGQVIYSQDDENNQGTP